MPRILLRCRSIKFNRYKHRLLTKSRCAALGHGNRHSRAPNGRLGCYDCFHAGRRTFTQQHQQMPRILKFLFFWRNKQELEIIYAVLHKHTYGDAESAKIASDVMVGSISSGNASVLINNSSFTYPKYSSVRDKDIIGDWYCFNGTGSSKMAADVIY